MSPRSSQQNEQLRELSRTKILETALELFAHHGFASTSVRMIAQQAGIAQGLLYNYFENKEALLSTLIQESMSDVRSTFPQVTPGDDPSKQIEHLIRSAFAMIREKQSFWKLIYSVRMQHSTIPSLDNSIAIATQEILQNIEGYLRAARLARADLEAVLLFGVIDGVAQHYVLNPDNYPLDEITDQLVARYRSIIEQAQA